jgi:mRNA-degrading endonuclease YafQ of YafQ-DinJ toxin-antitoxin module
MPKLRYTALFKRDFRRGVSRGCDPEKLRSLLELLRRGAPLPLSSRDGPLKNAEARACRVEPGWLLVYREKKGVVTLMRVKYIRKERPTGAPPMKLWFRTLLRSPVKTALTVLLLAVACFLLLDNLSSYAMQTEAIKQAEEQVEGVLTVERSQVRSPWDGTRSTFLLSDPTNPGETYREDCSYESTHHEALSASDLETLATLPYIDAVDRRYMTAGVSEDYFRIDGAYADYGYMDRLVIEATVTNINQGALIDMYKYDSAWRYILDDVNVLAGDRKTLDEQFKTLGGKARLIVNTLPENALGTGTRVYLGGLAGDAIDCLDYDITKEQVKDIKAGRRYVFVVRAPRYEAPDSSTFGFLLGDDSRKGWWPYWTDITDLSENYLESEEFAPLRQLIQVTNDDIRTFDVIYTNDMASIRRAARKQLTAAQGRLLSPTDEGTAVCVVSDRFLSENGLRLGDTITLKLGNHLMEQFQPLGAVAVTLGRYATQWEEHAFTIVGTWQDTGDSRWQEQEHHSFYSTGSLQEQDLFWAYSANAIFVPAAFLPVSCDTEHHRFRPAEVSFIVRDADNLAAFTEECLPIVEKLGLKYAWNDANWPILAEKMAQTRRLTMIKLLIFTVASLLAVGLTLYLFLYRRRKEYAILRALGTPRKDAAKALLLPLLVLADCSALLGLLLACLRSGAAVRQSAAEFAEAGLEAMPAAHAGVYLLGAVCLLAVTVLMAGAYLRALGKRSPLLLLQDSNRRKAKQAEQLSAEIDMEDMVRATAVLAVPVTAMGRPIKGFLRRYVLRHIRRAGLKTVLTLLLAALLVGAVGQLTMMRSRYAEMMKNVQVDVGFYDGLSLYRAERLMKSGLVREPVYKTCFEEAELELDVAQVTFTNQLGSTISDPITWLEGWDEESAMEEKGKVCILPAPIMEKLGIGLGDKVRVNEYGCIQYLAYGHSAALSTWEEGIALRDQYRPFYTVIGRVETTQEYPTTVYAPVSAFGSYSFFGTNLYLDSATFTLNDYRDADKVRQMAAEIQYTAKKPPVFRMDTSDADRIYRVYRLIQTLYPLTVAAALVLGTLLPGLMILQEQKEAAVLRALGWSKKLTVRRLTLEQAALCLAGLVLALLALFAVNGSGFLGVIAVPLAYAAAHFALCVAASAAVSASILRKSPMRLLQVKE